MYFKKMRGVGLSYEDQGYLFFHCKRYCKLTEDEREKIDRLIARIAGPHFMALQDALTGRKSITLAAMDNYIDKTLLYRLRHRFFEEWYRIK